MAAFARELGAAWAGASTSAPPAAASVAVRFAGPVARFGSGWQLFPLPAGTATLSAAGVSFGAARQLTGIGFTAILGSDRLQITKGHGSWGQSAFQFNGRLTDLRLDSPTLAAQVSAQATAEQLLVATGRRANTRGFGLETVGVTLGTKGEIVVNGFLQTANPDIYAAGDVIGDPMFVYVAAYAGSLAAENALTGNVRRYDLATLPKVTFTDPAVASVGLADAQARAQGVEPLVATLSLEHVPRALAARDTRGFVKLVADAATRKIVGAHILAAEAGEMITEPALAIKHGLTIEDLTAAFHPYLTLSEGIKLAAQTFDKDVARLSCCAA